MQTRTTHDRNPNRRCRRPRSCASTARSTAPTPFTASAMTAATSGPRSARGWWPSIRPADEPCARWIAPAMPAPPSTAPTCTRSPRRASTRSIQPAARWWPRSRRRARACDSGLAWAEGSLWVGQYRERKIHQIDPDTGAIVRTIESDRFVTGVTWVDGELWHGTWEGDDSDIRHIDADSGEVLERLQMPRGTGVSGLESDGAGLFYAGGGNSGTIRAVRRPEPRHRLRLAPSPAAPAGVPREGGCGRARRLSRSGTPPRPAARSRHAGCRRPPRWSAA